MIGRLVLVGLFINGMLTKADQVECALAVYRPRVRTCVEQNMFDCTDCNRNDCVVSCLKKEFAWLDPISKNIYKKTPDIIRKIKEGLSRPRAIAFANRNLSEEDKICLTWRKRISYERDGYE